MSMSLFATPNPVLGGDLTGTANAATVAKLLGRTLHTTAPTDGQALIWDNANSRWAPTTIAGVTSMRPATKVVVASTGAGGTWNGDYTCDGTSDNVEIQAAVDACAAVGGGRVLLTGGTFKTLASVKMKNGVEIWGMGWSTVVQPQSNSFSDGALFENADTTQHAWGLYNMMLQSGGFTGTLGYIHGIFLNNAPTSNSFAASPPTDPDTAQIMEGLLIYNMKGHGILSSTSHAHAEGSTSSSNVRGAYLRKMFILFATKSGLIWHGSDCFFDSVVCGGHNTNSVDSGIVLAGSNHRMVNCKSYYAGKTGLSITGNRNQIAAFEAQDCGWHGISVEGTRNILSGVTADSSGRLKAGNGGVAHGINVTGSRNVVTFTSFNRFDTYNVNGQGATGWTTITALNMSGGTDNILIGSVDVFNHDGAGSPLIKTYGGTRTGQTVLAVTTTETDGGGQPMDEFRQGTGRSYFYTPNAAPTDSYIGNLNITIWMDTSTTPPVLKFRGKNNTGTAYTFAITGA